MQITRRKRLLYIMGIDWNWIFQRPQILEQHLEVDYDVTVVFPRSILHRAAADEMVAVQPEETRILWTIPRQERYGFLRKVSSLLNREVFQNLDRYAAVIIGYPLYYRYISSSYHGKVLYDCMDYHKALYPDPRSLNGLLVQEDRLIRESDHIIVTSGQLYRNMLDRGADAAKIRLIRNGTNIDRVVPPDNRIPQEKKTYKIGYFGTIAEWFDYELLEDSLENYRNVEYHLIGPVRKESVVRSDRLIMEGVVRKDQLPDYTAEYDCFIMPFLVNDVVEWVDPVKLYEYIALGKCIISVRYAEIERFEPFVYMYTDGAEYRQLLGKLIETGFPAKYSAEQQHAFLEENSWDRRFDAWDDVLDQVLKN